jgi:hypothetical protein
MSLTDIDEFVQKWKAVQDVSKLNRTQCLKYISYLNPCGNIMSIFDDSQNCRLFCSKFNLPFVKAYEILWQKIDQLQGRLRQITPLMDLKVPEICSLSLDAENEFSRYKNLSLSQDFRLFADLFTDIYRIYYNKLLWIFICTPSGTGKTQLAFSLPMKRLYFLMEPQKAKSQSIYQPFEVISQKLWNLISQDIIRLQNVSNNCYVELPMLFNDTYITGESLSASATFILFMIKNLANEPLSEWLSLERLQMNLPHEEGYILTIDQLAEEIEFFFHVLKKDL